MTRACGTHLADGKLRPRDRTLQHLRYHRLKSARPAIVDDDRDLHRRGVGSQARNRRVFPAILHRQIGGGEIRHDPALRIDRGNVDRPRRGRQRSFRLEVRPAGRQRREGEHEHQSNPFHHVSPTRNQLTVRTRSSLRRPWVLTRTAGHQLSRMIESGLTANARLAGTALAMSTAPTRTAGRTSQSIATARSRRVRGPTASA